MYELTGRKVYRKLTFARAGNPCAVSQVVSVSGEETSRTIKTNTGPIVLEEGMWVVEYLTSPHLFVWLNSVFQRHFEAVSA